MSVFWWSRTSAAWRGCRRVCRRGRRCRSCTSSWSAWWLLAGCADSPSSPSRTRTESRSRCLHKQTHMYLSCHSFKQVKQVGAPLKFLKRGWVVKGGTLWAFWNPILLQKWKKTEGWTLWKLIKNFRKKVSQSQKRGGKSPVVPKKVERGTLLLWNGFLSHVRGFGCVENAVLSTYGKSA